MNKAGYTAQDAPCMRTFHRHLQREEKKIQRKKRKKNFETTQEHNI